MTVDVTYQIVFQKLKKMLGEQESRATSDLIFRELGYPPTIRITRPFSEIDQNLFDRIMKIVDELLKGRPVQYILGYTWFCDFKIYLTPDVLIPRPETEEMTDLILREKQWGNCDIIDIGTGSGCIAVALAGKLSSAKVTAIDISNSALEVAGRNAFENNVHIDFRKSDILQNPVFNQNYDLIISNPPYVRESEKSLMNSRVLDYEPELALFVPDHDPLLYYRAIADFSLKHLTPGGFLFLEINENLGQETARLFSGEVYSEVGILKDMQNKNRFIKAIRHEQ